MINLQLEGIIFLCIKLKIIKKLIHIILYMKHNAFHKANGWIEVICGPMFAGKSEELLRRINRFKYADISYIIFKPMTDSRTKNKSESRDGRCFDAIEIKTSQEIIDYLNKQKEEGKYYDAIAIDEVQFFDDNIGEICNTLANNGYIVYAAGLDLNFKGEPFTSIGNLLVYADYVTKLKAICTICGCEATHTQRLINGEPASINDPLIQIGDNESYEARCRTHHEVKK